MFDWLRGLTKSAEDRRQERTIAYVDGTLSEQDKLQFEAEMARDAALRQDVDDLRQIKGALASMPRQRVPRNFTLDPAVYGKPAPAYDVRFYPVLQAATALSALVFIIFATLTYFPGAGFNSASETASAPQAIMVEQASDSVDNAADAVADFQPTAIANSAEMEEEDAMDEVAADFDDSAEMADAEMMADEESAETLEQDFGADADAAASSAMVEEDVDSNAFSMQSADEATDDVAADAGMMEEAASDAAGASAAAEPEVTAPRTNIVVIPSEDAAESEAEFRSPSPEELEQTQSTAVPELAAPEMAVEIEASETAPDSKTSVQTEDVAVETVDSAEQSLSESPALPIWLIVLGLLFIALLASTLWVRSRL